MPSIDLVELPDHRDAIEGLLPDVAGNGRQETVAFLHSRSLLFLARLESDLKLRRDVSFYSKRDAVTRADGPFA
jgi:hypothetical protein